jgi:alcohol dehydrogenase
MKLTINTNIIDKKNSLKSIKKEIKNLGFKHPLIICDKVLNKNKYIKNSTKNIKKRYIEFSSEPSYEKLNNEIKKIKKLKNLDCIIGIGGGSALDFSKGIALLYKNKGPALKFMGFPKNINKPLPVIAIPTTTSTGSEVIFNAVFTDIKNKRKLGINSEKNYPILSILDVRLIKSAPKKIIYQSAISSLLRSIETFTSVDGSNVTKLLSINSYQILMEAFKSKRWNDNFYNKLQWGCVFSMWSLSNSSGGPCGAINYYLSVNYNISQPLAYNFTTIEFIKKNIEKGYLGYSDLISKKNTKRQKVIQTKKFIKSLEKILNRNSATIKKAKSILKSDHNFDYKIYNIFKDNNFVFLEKNPVKLTKNDLKKIIERIKK